MSSFTMHSVPEGGSSVVPAFLTKLWTLVEDPSCNDLICWDLSGKSFHVYDQNRFSKEVLPLYFKHSNIASFIRQLNMYGFRKVMNMGQGALKIESDEMEFQHPYFQRDQEELLELIKRKQVSTTTKSEEMKVKPEDVNKVLMDVKTMKGKHDTVNVKLDSLKRENEALWREVATLRQQHKKHEQIVSKLIQFLVSMVGRGNRGLSVKRTLPLMIDDAPSEVPTKKPKFGKQISFDASEFTFMSPKHATEVDDASLSGPVIHDITDVDSTDEPEPIIDPIITSPATPPKVDEDKLTTDMPSDNRLEELEQLNIPAPSAQVPAALLEDDSPSDSEATDDPFSMNSSALSHFQKAASQMISLPPSVPAKLDLAESLDSVQFDLDSLKDLLTSGHYNLDNSTIQGLQNLIDEEEGKVALNSGNIVGNELIQYNPQDEFLNLLDYSYVPNEDQATSGNYEQTGELNTPQPNALMEPFGDASSSVVEDVD